MNLTPLKYILLIENVTTVFRNYLCLKRRTRIIALLWVVIESFNIAFGVVTNFISESKHLVNVQRIYFFSSTGFSIYVMIASLCYSKTFYNLLLNYDAFYKILDDESYTQRMLKAQKVSTSVVVSCCGFLSSAFTYIRVSGSDTTGYTEMGFAVNIIYQYINTISDFRYIFQYFVVHCIFFVVSEQLQAVTRSMNSEMSAIRENQRKIEHGESLSRIAINRDRLNKWVKAYENINDSSNLCNSIFSVQLTVMLLIVTVYYIILLYSITIITVKGAASLTSLLPNLLFMVVFLSAVLLISHAGQQIQNSYVGLRQKLCELCVNTLENEECYKLTKNLLRYVRTRPVHVHVFGTLEVNMSMLPSIVAFFTSYTVIALQFNNVV